MFPEKGILKKLIGIQGYNVESIIIEEDCVIVTIEKEKGSGYQCGVCGESYLICYDCLRARRVRDFPISGRRCYLEFTPRRVYCDRCKRVLVEGLGWIEPFGRMTIRYERYVASLCDYLPVLDVAEIEGIDKNSVYRIDRKWLKRRKELKKDSLVRYLGIDEIAIKKGHQYATVFYDLERKEVIGLVKKRRQRSVSGFFRRWGKSLCRGVKAVCMDLWSAFANSVKIHCPKAEVVFDKFHVYTYLSQSIDQVRREEKSKKNQSGESLIAGTRWLWLKKKDHLKRKEKHKLEEVLRVNENMQKAYLLKEDFEQFYESENEQQAREFLQDWTDRCEESGLTPFKKLAKRLNRWSEGILKYFKYRITNAVSEGINNKIKVLKRRSYGFHDLDYFFLKILNITGFLPPLAEVTHTNRE